MQILWNTGTWDEDNPDCKLAVINAANEGFQSKMSNETGSHVLTQFMEKLGDIIDRDGKNKNMVLFRILEDIQEELHQRGKQLLVMHLIIKLTIFDFQSINLKKLGINLSKVNQLN